MTIAPAPKLGSPTVAARLFGVDLRSLAAFRIAAGIAVLVDLLLRARFLTAFYTDRGVLPRFARILAFEDTDPAGYRHAWSLHMLSGELWAQAIMFLLAGVFAF